MNLKYILKTYSKHLYLMNFQHIALQYQSKEVLYLGWNEHHLTLIWVGEGEEFYPPSRVSLNNSKMIRAVTLEFYNIQ